jgi:putative addiction module antidote
LFKWLSPHQWPRTGDLLLFSTEITKYYNICYNADTLSEHSIEDLTMATLKLRKVGGSVGVIIPKEILDALHLAEGDQMFASTSNNGLHLTPYDPDFDAAIDAFSRTRRKYRNALRKLAK